MNAKRTLALSAVTGLALGAIVAAQDAPASLAQAPAEAASEPAAAIISVVDEKSIDLTAAYPSDPAAAGRTFRARKVALAPGARTQSIAGDNQPAIYYVTAGEIQDYRGANAAPTRRALHEAGALRRGETYQLANESDAPAEVLIVDIIEASSE